MQKLTDAQQRAVEAMRRWGRATQYDQRPAWYIQCYFSEDIRDSTMRVLERLGIVKIDGNTATLTEVQDEKVE